MTEENVKDALKSTKYHIKFLQSLLKHIKGNDVTAKVIAMFTIHRLHCYINDKLMKEVDEAIKEYTTEPKKLKRNLYDS